MNQQITELKDSIIRNETSFPEIFNMTEDEVLGIINAASNYLGDSGKDTLCSYRDWCLMYQGIHSEGTWESTQRNWLAAIRWFKKQSPSAPKVEVSAEQPVTFQEILDKRFEPTNPNISFEDLKGVIGYDFHFYQDCADNFNEHFRLMINSWEYMQKWFKNLKADNQILFEKTSSLQQENDKLREEVGRLRSALEEIASYKYPHSSIVKATIIADNALNKKP